MKHYIPALPQTEQSPAALRRPRLLVMAARSLVQAQRPAAQKHSLARIVANEADLEQARQRKNAGYRAETHIRALAALILAIKGANAPG
ncbi:hypothetical protein FHS89_001830 [Rubricella aquisinus]|uniref:Uncharacterized protein n=1 Tax=Rubricella aquisinus TaxID=2028108 RepID=A0A840WXA7_9RHOB|nr:DUF6477 family protein [Rubricella aquisinus]MBB5515810.1 hypothetical protein [Rubricella aquisinus]